MRIKVPHLPRRAPAHNPTPSEERRVTALLVFIAVNILVISPLSNQFGLYEELSTVSNVLVLLVALTIVPAGRQRFAMGALMCLAVAIRLAGYFFDIPGLAAADLFARIAFYTFFLVTLLEFVNRSGPVTGHRIRQAIALYLLIAVYFGSLYALVETVSPGSFQVPGWWQRGAPNWKGAFVYFSLVTMTTVGYGDITAIHPVARSLAMIEALIGQLYPAILIARLVTMELSDRTSRSRHDGKGDPE